MAIQVALIGLGQIGASFGMAMANQKPPIQRIGHDLEIGIARQAEKKGAVDKTSFSLPGSVREADFVILSIPLDQVRPTLEVIAPDLRENCVVFDTSPVKRRVLEWAQEALPPNRHFIGLTPVLNGMYLQASETGIAAAHADLFKQGMLAIVSLPGTPERALRLATDLAVLVGADHMFIDPLEVDSMMAALHLLPQLSAAALVQATIKQPGWIDARKLSGRAFAGQVQAVNNSDTPAALATAAVYNRENTTRVIDNLIEALYNLRDAIQEENLDGVTDQLAKAQAAHLEWLGDRLQGNWMAKESAQSSTEMPGAGDVLGRLIGIRPKDSRKSK
jgi:prephenate dehydrogenase